jgi:hypothetical protein
MVHESMYLVEDHLADVADGEFAVRKDVGKVENVDLLLLPKLDTARGMSQVAEIRAATYASSGLTSWTPTSHSGHSPRPMACPRMRTIP